MEKAGVGVPKDLPVKIVDKFRTAWRKEERNVSGSTPTPSEFLEFILSDLWSRRAANASSANVHWSPQWTRCPYCQVGVGTGIWDGLAEQEYELGLKNSSMGWVGRTGIWVGLEEQEYELGWKNRSMGWVGGTGV